MALWRVLTRSEVSLEDLATILVRRDLTPRRTSWVVVASEDVAARLRRVDGVVGIAPASDEDILQPFH